MLRPISALLALLVTQAYADQTPAPAVGTVSIDTGTDVGLSWSVNVSYIPQGDDQYTAETSSQLLWTTNGSLGNLVYDVWHDVNPSEQPQNLTVALFAWDHPPAAAAGQVSSNGSCDGVLGSSCVQAVLSSNTMFYSTIFNISQCSNTVGNTSTFPGVIASTDGPLAVTSNKTNTTATPMQGIAGFGDSNLNSSNLTALYEAQGRVQILLLRGLPQDVLACQIVNTSALTLTSAAVATVAPRTSTLVVVFLAALLAML